MQYKNGRRFYAAVITEVYRKPKASKGSLERYAVQYSGGEVERQLKPTALRERNHAYDVVFPPELTVVKPADDVVDASYRYTLKGTEERGKSMLKSKALMRKPADVNSKNKSKSRHSLVRSLARQGGLKPVQKLSYSHDPDASNKEGASGNVNSRDWSIRRHLPESTRVVRCINSASTLLSTRNNSSLQFQF